MLRTVTRLHSTIAHEFTELKLECCAGLHLRDQWHAGAWRPK